jgi:hypothetical protein
LPGDAPTLTILPTQPDRRAVRRRRQELYAVNLNGTPRQSQASRRRSFENRPRNSK